MRWATQNPAGNWMLLVEKPDLETAMVVCMELAAGRFRAIAGEETRHSTCPSSSLEPSRPFLLSHASPPELLWQRRRQRSWQLETPSRAQATHAAVLERRRGAPAGSRQRFDQHAGATDGEGCWRCWRLIASAVPPLIADRNWASPCFSRR